MSKGVHQQACKHELRSQNLHNEFQETVSETCPPPSTCSCEHVHRHTEKGRGEENKQMFY